MDPHCKYRYLAHQSTSLHSVAKSGREKRSFQTIKMVIFSAKSIIGFAVAAIYVSSMHVVDAFSAARLNKAGDDHKRIYGIAQSGWKSPAWNWGSAVGTGHDCARICRQNYASREARADLVENLLATTAPIPTDFEEVKLVLALAWQRGRWDGSDGGRGGYGDVLHYMAEAKRYEDGSAEECAVRLIQDMQARYGLLRPSSKQETAMQNLMVDCESDVYRAQRRCSGLVLKAMGFVKNGC